MKRPKGLGAIHERGTPGFDEKVLATSFNSRDPGHRPQVLIEANDVFDVINAVKRANRENLKVSIVSGGHSWSQSHLREGSLLISMARFNDIRIDVANETAILGPGCWSIDVDRACKKHNLFFPIAHAPDVCMGGFMLQGGFGWGSMVHGNACQSLIGIDVVLADGSLVHASEDENSELFWAARGAGPGFFAIVINYHVKVHKRFKFQGMKMQVFRMKHMEDVYSWADEVGDLIPRSIELMVLMTPKAMGIFSPGLEVLAPVMTDSYKQAKEDVSFMTNSKVRSKASMTTPLIPISSMMMSSAVNITHFPADAKWCTDNAWLDAPVADMIPTLRKIRDTMPPAPSHSLWMNWRPLENRPDMVNGMDTNRYLANYGEWKDPKDDAKYENWATDVTRELEPFSIGCQLADENLLRRPAKFTQDEKMVRLDKVRAKYDPKGLFNSWAGRAELG